MYVFTRAFLTFCQCFDCKISTTSMSWAPAPNDGRVLGSGTPRRLCRGPGDLTACHFCCFWLPESDDGCIVDPELTTDPKIIYSFVRQEVWKPSFETKL